MIRYEPHLVTDVENGLGIRHELIAFFIYHARHNDRHMCKQTQFAYTQTLYLRIGQRHVVTRYRLLFTLLCLHFLFLFLYADTEYPAE